MTDTKHFVIRGLGVDQRSSAKDFMGNFHRFFPKIKGTYELILKEPLSYDIDLDGNHCYMIKGSTNLLVRSEANDQ